VSTNHHTIQSLKDRFEKHISMEPMTGCWLWTGYSDKDGYGNIFVEKGKSARAPRVSYELYIGPIPEGLFPCHYCDTPACCSPYHLFAGTNLDNIRDCMKKGRRASKKGEHNNNAKLTDEQVRAIIEDPRPRKVIAEEYRVTHSLICYIKRGKIWTHI
jgi:hypothetical protein